MALRIFVNSKEGTSCHSSCNEDYLVRDLFCDLFPEKNIRLIALIRLYVTYQNEEIHGNTKIFDMLSSGLGNTKDTALKISVGSIVVDGFPPLKSLKPIGSCSSASQSNHSELENKMVSNFTTLFTNQQLKDQVQSSSTLWVDYPDGIPYWSSESEIKGFVQRGLQCLLKEIGLTDIIFLSEVSLFDQADNTDILVVSLLGVPIGVIEVKRPQWRNETSPTDDLRCLGQLFDYVHHLRAYSGRQHAFGILTTYHEWRIVWLSDNDDVARSNTLLPTNQSETSVSVFPQDIPNWSSSNNFPPTQSDVHPQKLSRELCVSDIYLYNDANLPNVLVSVLKKMKNSPLILPNPSKLVKQWPYIYLSSGSMEWHRPSTDTQLQIEGRAPEFFQTVYLLADLGGGGDGRVWLATTPNGKVCVLKFSLDKQSLDQECEIWNKLWPFTKVSVKKLWDKHVLVMPWAKPCSQEELNDPKIFGLVKKNLKRLTAAGLKHDDMKLSHVGLYKNANSELDIVFFDFARISKINTASGNATSALAEMMKKLNMNFVVFENKLIITRLIVIN